MRMVAYIDIYFEGMRKTTSYLVKTGVCCVQNQTWDF
jgi:hypothetical protein